MHHKHGELAATDLIIFTYDELKCASRDFGNDMCLGKGLHGPVYKGWIDKMTNSLSRHDTRGLPIAIKKIHSYKFVSPKTAKYRLFLSLLLYPQ